MKIIELLLAGIFLVTFSLGAYAEERPWPIATEDSATVTSNQRVYLPVLENDIGLELKLFDVDTTTVALGRVEIDSTSKAVYYQSASDYVGPDSFWYAFKDNLGRTNAAQVHLKVIEPVHVEPVEPSLPDQDYSGWPAANTDLVTTPKNVSVNVPVLANDVGQELVLLEVNSTTLALGSTVIQGDLVVYTPPNGFTGEDSFWYVFSDAQGRTNSAQVKVTVINEVIDSSPALVNFTLVKMHDKLLKRRSYIYGEAGGTLSVRVASRADQGDTQIRVGRQSGLQAGQLITYRSRQGDYYTTTVASISGQRIELSTPLEAPVDRGENVWNFYRDGAHPNLFGFRALADYALKEQDIAAINHGKHVLLGDSWFYNEGVSQRLAQKLPYAQVINQGIGGNTSEDMLLRFERDIATHNPDYVWLIAGTNDYYQGVSLQDYVNNMTSLIASIERIGAKAIVIDSSVAPLINGSSYLTELSHQYAEELANLQTR